MEHSVVAPNTEGITKSGLPELGVPPNHPFISTYSVINLLLQYNVVPP